MNDCISRELFEAEQRFQAERDRRYAEVNIEREKALKIKEEADKTALSLAREIQTYKDEKANDLRSQIERERGSYTTQIELKGAIDKIDATIVPLSTYVASQAGRREGIGVSANVLVICATLFLAIIGTAMGLWVATHSSKSPVQVTPITTTQGG